MKIRDIITLLESYEHHGKQFIDFGISDDILNNLSTQGFDITEPLFHGSTVEFNKFDRKFNRTASDIYTSPSYDTAKGYGDNVYLVTGKQNKQADLLDDWQLLSKLADVFADQFENSVETDEELTRFRESLMQELIDNSDDDNYDKFEAKIDAEDSEEYKQALRNCAKQYALEVLQSSTIYNDYGRNMQDNILSECFDMGYTSVRFYDGSSSGEPISVVFHNPEDLIILKKVD